MSFSADGREDANDEFYSLEESPQRVELAKEDTSKFGGVSPVIPHYLTVE